LRVRFHHPRAPGAKAYDIGFWLSVSLPILMVEGFYLLLSYTDVLVLQQYRSSQIGRAFARPGGSQ
jgi:hypothetical protein